MTLPGEVGDRCVVGSGAPGVKVFAPSLALPPLADVVALRAKLGNGDAGPANLSGNETWPLPPTNACAGFAGAAIRRSDGAKLGLLDAAAAEGIRFPPVWFLLGS